MTEAQRENKWQIERDANLLRDYATLAADDARMGAAQKYLEEEAANIAKAVGLKTALVEHYSKKES